MESHWRTLADLYRVSVSWAQAILYQLLRRPIATGSLRELGPSGAEGTTFPPLGKGIGTTLSLNCVIKARPSESSSLSLSVVRFEELSQPTESVQFGGTSWPVNPSSALTGIISLLHSVATPAFTQIEIFLGVHSFNLITWVARPCSGETKKWRVAFKGSYVCSSSTSPGRKF